MTCFIDSSGVVVQNQGVKINLWSCVFRRLIWCGSGVAIWEQVWSSRAPKIQISDPMCIGWPSDAEMWLTFGSTYLRTHCASKKHWLSALGRLTFWIPVPHGIKMPCGNQPRFRVEVSRVRQFLPNIRVDFRTGSASRAEPWLIFNLPAQRVHVFWDAMCSQYVLPIV